MTQFFSNFYGKDISTGVRNFNTAELDSWQANYPNQEVRLRAPIITVPTLKDIAIGDIISIADFHSGQRINGIKISADGELGAVTTFDVGLYVAGQNGTVGAVVDVDLFETTPLDLSGIVDRGEAFVGGILVGTDRGKTLWELAAVGAATYTVDPKVEFTIALTAVGAAAAVGANDAVVRVEIELLEEM